MNKHDLVRNILKLEWEMFSSVRNKGGKASCQEDYRTFAIMRTAQLTVWSQTILASYFLDLLEAKEIGRNLMTEKYARMMEITYPEEYEEIKGLLPKVSAGAKNMAKGILAVFSLWEEELTNQYPKVREHGRHRKSEGNMDGSVSAEDYQYCEFLTYSERTLQLILEYIGESPGHNLYMEELENMAKAYGYKNLEEAEQALK